MTDQKLEQELKQQQTAIGPDNRKTKADFSGG